MKKPKTPLDISDDPTEYLDLPEDHEDRISFLDREEGHIYESIEDELEEAEYSPEEFSDILDVEDYQED